MHHPNQSNTRANSPLPWLLAAACLVVILIGLLLPRKPDKLASINSSTNTTHPGVTPNFARPGGALFANRHGPTDTNSPELTAEQIVAAKVSQFAHKRRALAHALADHFKITVSDLADQFFAAAEAGHYDEMEALFAKLKDARKSDTTGDLMKYWRAIAETEGGAYAAHNWPAQKLLDYGQSILGSLSPGTVYVGGTDPGCFIPTMLNETSDGEHHVVLTQNALADSSYLDYLNYLYAGQLTPLTSDDSQKAFQDYLADAQKRLDHDQQFPDEPKQVRPGENILNTDGHVQVSGEVAVMLVNERLLQTLMQNNPGMPFALEESFSLPTTYPGAIPLGPIMELRAPDGQPHNTLTPEVADQSLDYWRATAQQLIADPDTPENSDPRKAYAHMAEADANLLASHNLNDQAEQAYRVASSIWPDSPNIIGGLSNLLATENRAAEANQLLDNFAQNHPDKLEEINTIRQNLPTPSASAQKH